jgi:putative endonuclease
MLSGRIARALIRVLDRIPVKSESNANIPADLLIGHRGEKDAYFYLRRNGYVIVARNYRTARHRGEIDLIGWDKDVLCFIEVKTRATRDVKPAEAAVDRNKRHDLRIVVGDYLRTLPRRQYPEPPPWRFDVITVYYDKKLSTDSSGSRPRVKMGQSRHLAKAARCRAPLHGVHHLRLCHPTFELFQNVALSS